MEKNILSTIDSDKKSASKQIADLYLIVIAMEEKQRKLEECLKAQLLLNNTVAKEIQGILKLLEQNGIIKNNKNHKIH